MNMIIIAGHLGTDPEVRYSPEGKKRTTFSVATNERRQGKDITTWWRVTVFGDQFDKLMPYLKKGSSVIVNGKMRFEDSGKPHIYTDKNGQPQASLEITANSIDFAPSNAGARQERALAADPHAQGQGSPFGSNNGSGSQAQAFTQESAAYGNARPQERSYATPQSFASEADDDMPF